MKRDKLVILNVNFQDPKYPGKRFYCWHCILLEGLLASFPKMAAKLDVERISWPRPRTALIDIVGESNQSVPILILADDAPAGLETGKHGDIRFIDDKDAILRALTVRYGIPYPHP